MQSAIVLRVIRGGISDRRVVGTVGIPDQYVIEQHQGSALAAPAVFAGFL